MPRAIADATCASDEQGVLIRDSLHGCFAVGVGLASRSMFDRGLSRNGRANCSRKLELGPGWLCPLHDVLYGVGLNLRLGFESRSTCHQMAVIPGEFQFGVLSRLLRIVRTCSSFDPWLAFVARPDELSPSDPIAAAQADHVIPLTIPWGNGGWRPGRQALRLDLARFGM